jgi:Reverse transcriptase (RNA-dependent DNA polymerase)
MDGGELSSCAIERFADDVIVHRRTEREAKEVRAAIGERFRNCGLELHPEKTKIVYCKVRKGSHTHEKFGIYAWPKDQFSVQLARGRMELRAVKPPIVLEPASDDGIVEPRQIFDRLIAARRYFPAPDRVSDRLRCGGGNCWTEVQEDLASATL